jgi:hypothetical protein
LCERVSVCVCVQRKRAHTRTETSARMSARAKHPHARTHAGSHLAGTGPGTGSEIHTGQTLARRARWTTLKPLAPRAMSNRRSRRLTSGCPQPGCVQLAPDPGPLPRSGLHLLRFTVIVERLRTSTLRDHLTLIEKSELMSLTGSGSSSHLEEIPASDIQGAPATLDTSCDREDVMDEDDGAQNPLLEPNGNVKQTHDRLSANQLKQLVLVLSLFQNVASIVCMKHASRHTFSKVLYVVTVYREYTRALTFENVKLP